jgi:hypothetical protein
MSMGIRGAWGQWGRGGGKEKTLRGEEDRNALHIYI